MLIRELSADHVYLACGHTDMRKSIDGLAAVVQSRFQLDLHQPALFLFCGRRKDRIKGLLWDEIGFLLLYKRLENGHYQWPDSRRTCWKYLPSSFAGSQRGCPYHSQEPFKKFILPIASSLRKLKPHMSSARAITGFAGLFVV